MSTQDKIDLLQDIINAAMAAGSYYTDESGNSVSYIDYRDFVKSLQCYIKALEDE